uniref:Oxysterol-binding protein n=1 Tax=Strigamia maritima TaxID=126957 RepID=T1IZZ7_STRMM
MSVGKMEMKTVHSFHSVPDSNGGSPIEGEGHYEEGFFRQYDSPSSTPKAESLKGFASDLSMSKLTKRESYKAQRKNYRREKKRVAEELMSTLRDSSIIVIADWVKIRGTLKGWTKLWCVVKPGLMLLYKGPKIHKSSYWVGTVMLNVCELIERPSKKDGFCFKLFHPLEQSIWASRGPSGETIGAVVQPLPTAYLIFRAPSEVAGKCWMEALQLTLRCPTSLTGRQKESVPALPTKPSAELSSPVLNREETPTTPTYLEEDGPQTQWNESDYERHFNEHDLEDDLHTDDNREIDPDGVHSLRSSDSDSDGHYKDEPELLEDEEPNETSYVENESEEFGLVGDAGQTEEFADENKSLIWSVVKQVRPGMDLSKVVLPTFILEPRSFLDKLTDYYYHADILSRAVLEDDPFTRMKMVVQWYMSGFYKKPRGLKKPYNPILGETFRCNWKHPETNSRTFYIAEQVSHHPPVSAFYVTNRKDGFCIRGSILAKSKFYGNSLSAILDGKARLSFLTRGEDYTMTMPYAHCKGILLGTLTMELGGKIQIDCEKTGYKTDIEFKLKPFFGGYILSNSISGRIRLGKETLANVEGHWDQEIRCVDKRTGEQSLLWSPTPEIRTKRLVRYTVPLESQTEVESEKLWIHVSAAISQGNQVAATEEKRILEEAQRQRAKERKVKCVEWFARYFEQDLISGEWVYKNADSRPWDPRNDVHQYECDYIIRTKTRHRTPIIRTSSIVSVDDLVPVDCLMGRGPRITKQTSINHRRLRDRGDSESSTQEAECVHASDSSDSERLSSKPATEVQLDSASFTELLKPIQAAQEKQTEQLKLLRGSVDHLLQNERRRGEHVQRIDWLMITAVLLVQMLINFVMRS